MTEIDHSLRRLGTDYVDLYQIHRFDPHTPVEETMEALHDVVKAGKVRYIGASSMYAWQFSKMQYTAERHGWTQVRVHAEPLQPPLPRGGARDAAALRGPGRRRPAVEPARPRPPDPGLGHGHRAQRHRQLRQHASTRRATAPSSRRSPASPATGASRAPRWPWPGCWPRTRWPPRSSARPSRTTSRTRWPPSNCELSEKEIEELEGPYTARPIVGHS